MPEPDPIEEALKELAIFDEPQPPPQWWWYPTDFWPVVRI